METALAVASEKQSDLSTLDEQERSELAKVREGKAQEKALTRAKGAAARARKAIG